MSNKNTVLTFLSMLEVESSYEEKIIVNLYQDKLFTDKIIMHLKPQYFESPEAKWLITYLQEYYTKHTKNSTYDATLLGIKNAKLSKEKREPIIKLLIKATKLASKYMHDYEEVQQSALDFCKTQEYTNALLDASDLLTATGEDRFEKIQHRIERASIVGQATSMGINWDDIEDRRHNTVRTEVTPLPWKAINDQLGGGLGLGEFMTIVAPMGAGKTMIVANLAHHFRKLGDSCLAVSTELGERKIRHRIDTIALQSRLSDMGESAEYADRVKEVIATYPKGYLNLIKFSQSGTTANDIRTNIRLHRAHGNVIKTVLIDYLDVMEPNDPALRVKKDWEKFEVISRDIYTLCSEENLRIIALLQGNTTAIDDEVITASSTSGGAKRLHPADLILGYARPPKLKMEERANFSYIKNRFGKDGMVHPVETDYNRCYINVLDETKSMSEPEDFNAEESIVKKWEEHKKKKKRTFDGNPFQHDGGTVGIEY